MQLSVRRYPASPDNHGLTEVVLVDNMIHFEHIKSIQHAMPVYLICIVGSTNQMRVCRVPRENFRPKMKCTTSLLKGWRPSNLFPALVCVVG